jgi:hypothetical protein
VARAVELDAVVGGVAALAGALGDAVEVRPVADEVVGRGQRRAGLGRQPGGAGGAEADDGQGSACGRGRGSERRCGRGRRLRRRAAPRRHEHERHVRHGALDLVQRRDALVVV